MSEFYLTSRHGDCGTNVMFHRTNGAGYTTNLDELEIIGIEEAQECADRKIGELPLLKSAVDALAIRAVDCQYLEDESNLPDPNNEYVVQVERNWNGNDIAFVTPEGMTYNYDEAKIMDLKTAELVGAIGGKVWSKSYLDTLARRTFQRENISTRKMITGPGIKYKKPRKKRPTTGKTRFNCPSCGKINWQYNPYDFEGCSDIMCDEY